MSEPTLPVAWLPGRVGSLLLAPISPAAVVGLVHLAEADEATADQAQDLVAEQTLAAELWSWSRTWRVALARTPWRMLYVPTPPRARTSG